MLNTKESKQLEQFRKGLQMPRWQFVVRKGMLGWGISTALVYTFLVNILIEGKSGSSILSKHLWINLLTFMLGGIFFGLLLRGFMSRQVKKLEAMQDKPE